MRRAFLSLLFGSVVGTGFSADLFFAGDSTLHSRHYLEEKDYPSVERCLGSWCDELESFLKPGVRIFNHAYSGESTKSFIDNGRWGRLIAQVKSGDFVYMQFGHNDQKKSLETHYAAADGAYRENLTRFVREVRERGGKPVFGTPMVRRFFDEKTGKVADRLEGYPDAVRALGRELDVPVVDFNAFSRKLVEGVRQEESLTWYRAIVDGTDMTHPNKRGARIFARAFCDAIKAQGLELAGLFLDDRPPVRALVPMPRKVEWTEGTCAGSVGVAERTDPEIPSEGYWLEIGPGAIELAASGPAGFLYGRQTLRQLDDGGIYPCCRIVDAPAYPWRGLHLDVARHFFGKETVLKLLESMAGFKLNVLHWHLTDNQGWRMPIPGYPKLTEAVRPVENRTNFCDLSKTGTYGPYSYAKAELQEIVRRAAELNIRIVPEIEIPGHSEALLKVCPELACTVTNREVSNAVCVGKDATIRFFERTLDEVCSVFPDAVVHIGGDECDRRDWKRCPDCQARMKREGLADVAALQSWTTAHFERYLRGKGRRLMGWDEIAEGGLPPGTMVMSWRGTHTGIRAAKGGQDVVMTPNEYCYFDFSQGLEGDPHPYPYNWTAILPLAKVYSFDPARGIPDEYRRHVLGAQGNNWSEMMRTEDELEWKVWPRAAALAEVLWTNPTDRDFTSFLRRMEPRWKELVGLGVNAAPLELRRTGSRPRGELVRTRTGCDEELRYTCGGVVSSLTLVGGRLDFISPGKDRHEFRKNEFDEIDVVTVEEGVYLVTARRPNSDIVVTVLFDGERIIIKDRYDYREDDK